MSIFVNKDNQQLGPYEDHIVIDQLKSGMLSPNDLGIREGDSAWQKLGDMFPTVRESHSAPAPNAVAAGIASPVTSDNATPKKGGCRKMLGWGLLLFGLLTMLSGFAVAIVNRTTDPYLCQQADRYAKEAEEASREVQAAKGTIREVEAVRKLMEKNTSLKVSTESCADMLDYYRWWFIAFLAIGGFGFIIAIVGFFIRRV